MSGRAGKIKSLIGIDQADKTEKGLQNLYKRLLKNGLSG